MISFLRFPIFLLSNLDKNDEDQNIVPKVPLISEQQYSAALTDSYPANKNTYTSETSKISGQQEPITLMSLSKQVAAMEK